MDGGKGKTYEILIAKQQAKAEQERQTQLKHKLKDESYKEKIELCKRMNQRSCVQEHEKTPTG